VPPTPVPLSQPTLVGNQCWDITSGGSGAANNGPGVYCSTGAITVNKNFVGYTWFAKCISIAGNGHTFTYYGSIPASEGSRQQTLFYASGDDAACAALGAKPFTIQGQTNTINGDVFAPFGAINIQGGGVAGGQGFLEAQTMSLAGNFATYLGTGPLEGATIQVVTTTDPDTTVTNTTTDPDTTQTDTTVSGGTTSTTYSTTPGGTTTYTFPGTTYTVTNTTSTSIGLGE
jgi:hypothetical protein